MASRRRGASEWAALVDDWKQSGLDLPEFCRRRGLSRGTIQGRVYKPARKTKALAASNRLGLLTGEGYSMRVELYIFPIARPRHMAYFKYSLSLSAGAVTVV